MGLSLSPSAASPLESAFTQKAPISRLESAFTKNKGGGDLPFRVQPHLVYAAKISAKRPWARACHKKVKRNQYSTLALCLPLGYSSDPSVWAPGSLGRNKERPCA